MSGVRSTGFAVLLTVMALLIGQFAVNKHNERKARLASASANSLYDANQASSFDEDEREAGNVEFSDFRNVDSSGYPIVHRDIGSAQEARRIRDRGNILQVGNPPSAVPAPVDSTSVDDSSADSSPEREMDTSGVRTVIEQELSHATREERDIWFEELKSLPAGVVRDLLQVRKQIRELPRLMGGIPEKLASADIGIANRTQEITAEPASQKIRFGIPDQLNAATEIEAAISQLRHNLTNAATPGFKRLRVTLVDNYRPAERESAASEIPDPEAFGTRFQGEGCRLAPLLLDLKQGTFKKTERQFDLGIDGEGFFVVRCGEKDCLTRCGAFTLDRNRQLCLATFGENAVLQPPICVPESAREIQVSADGKVTYLKPGETELTLIAVLQLARVPGPARLHPVGNTLFVASQESGDITLGNPMQNGLGEIQQGVLEQSNVDFEQEREEIEELAMILKSLPIIHSRPATASKLLKTPAH